jgi:hypothetical protein
MSAKESKDTEMSDGEGSDSESSPIQKVLGEKYYQINNLFK